MDITRMKQNIHSHLSLDILRLLKLNKSINVISHQVKLIF